MCSADALQSFFGGMFSMFRAYWGNDKGVFFEYCLSGLKDGEMHNQSAGGKQHLEATWASFGTELVTRVESVYKSLPLNPAASTVFRGTKFATRHSRDKFLTYLLEGGLTRVASFSSAADVALRMTDPGANASVLDAKLALDKNPHRQTARPWGLLCICDGYAAADVSGFNRQGSGPTEKEVWLRDPRAECVFSSSESTEIRQYMLDTSTPFRHPMCKEDVDRIADWAATSNLMVVVLVPVAAEWRSRRDALASTVTGGRPGSAGVSGGAAAQIASPASSGAEYCPRSHARGSGAREHRIAGPAGPRTSRETQQPQPWHSLEDNLPVPHAPDSSRRSRGGKAAREKRKFTGSFGTSCDDGSCGCESQPHVARASGNAEGTADANGVTDAHAGAAHDTLGPRGSSDTQAWNRTLGGRDRGQSDQRGTV